MREIYSHRDFHQVALRRSVLEAAGIPCFIRNETSYRIADAFGGFLACFFPIPEWWPNLCVIHEEHYIEALQLLRAPSASVDHWRCPKCGEEVPLEFDTCWNCLGADEHGPA
jgi:hypothetical protein